MSTRYRPMHAFSRMIEAGVHPVGAFNQTHFAQTLLYQCRILGELRAGTPADTEQCERLLGGRFRLSTWTKFSPATHRDGGIENSFLSVTSRDGSQFLLEAQIVSDYRRVAEDYKGSPLSMVVDGKVTSNLERLRQLETSTYNAQHAVKIAALREIAKLGG